MILKPYTRAGPRQVSKLGSRPRARPEQAFMNTGTELTQLLNASQRVLIFTGAGISTGSGIPDYRGPQGVWQKRRPIYYQEFMRSHASRVEYWDFKLEGYAAYRDAQPNAVHRAIVQLERAQKLEAVVTQNIDGLHRKAGTAAERLVELHGTETLVACQSCHQSSDPTPHFRAFERTGEPPTCSACGGWLKPATISFGQNLRSDDLARAVAAGGECTLVLALGSTLSVYPAAQIPLIATQDGKTPYVIINRGATDHDDLNLVTLRLEGDVGEIFPGAVAAVCA